MGRGINPKYNKLPGEKIKKRRGSTPRVVDMNYGPLRKNLTLTRLHIKSHQKNLVIKISPRFFFSRTFSWKKNGLEEFLCWGCG